MAHEVTIYGASDDLIEVEGEVSEEFNALGDDGEAQYVALSDGTLVRVVYGDNGCWEIRADAVGEGTDVKHVAHDNDETTYTDRLTLTRSTPFKWATHSKGKPAKRRKS